MLDVMILKMAFKSNVPISKIVAYITVFGEMFVDAVSLKLFLENDQNHECDSFQ